MKKMIKVHNIYPWTYQCPLYYLFSHKKILHFRSTVEFVTIFCSVWSWSSSIYIGEKVLLIKRWFLVTVVVINDFFYRCGINPSHFFNWSGSVIQYKLAKLGYFRFIPLWHFHLYLSWFYNYNSNNTMLQL